LSDEERNGVATPLERDGVVAPEVVDDNGGLPERALGADTASLVGRPAGSVLPSAYSSARASR
jgi:hypothetical protein